MIRLIVAIIARGRTNTLSHVCIYSPWRCLSSRNKLQNTREEDSTKSGMTQEVSPQQVEA